MNIVERIIQLVKDTSVIDADYVAWNEESKTFSSNGCCDGIKIEESDIPAIVERMVKELPYPITLYRGRDDGIVTFETEVTIEDITDAFELEMEGLFIGWD